MTLRALAVVCVLAAPASGQEPAETQSVREQTEKNPAASCLQPPPLVRWEDYHGPLEKVVGAFARTLERKSAHAPHYKPGATLCSLEPGDKFVLFVQDTFDPVSFLAAGFGAGLDQAENHDAPFGQGGEGYAKRFGANFADLTSARFFSDFVYPTIFSEDPRYYRLGHGGAGKRLLHAAGHVFVAHRDDGRHMFNFSEWLGTASAVALSDTYHPGNAHGFAPAARQVGYSVMTDVGLNVLREFWPEIARKLKMPFRERHEPETDSSKFW